MLAFIKGMFTSKSSIDKALDTGDKITTGLISGLDKIWYTDEEKSEARQKANDTILKFWKIIGSENSAQSTARRELAKMVFKVYFFLILLAVSVWKIDVNYADFIFTVVSDLSFLVSLIAGSYFIPHQLTKIMKKK